MIFNMYLFSILVSWGRNLVGWRQRDRGLERGRPDGVHDCGQTHAGDRLDPRGQERLLKCAKVSKLLRLNFDKKTFLNLALAVTLRLSQWCVNCQFCEWEVSIPPFHATIIIPTTSIGAISHLNISTKTLLILMN